MWLIWLMKQNGLNEERVFAVDQTTLATIAPFNVGARSNSLLPWQYSRLHGEYYGMVQLERTW